MIYIIFFFLLVFLIKKILTLLGILQTISFIRRKDKFEISSTDNLPNIIVILPVLREQSKIEDAISHFNSSNYTNLSIVVVTNEKELIDSEATITTIDVIKKLQMKYDFHWLHMKNINGVKADQLNYVTDNFKKLFPNKSEQNSFFIYYDADSRPNLQVLPYLASLIKANQHINVYQQSSIFYHSTKQKWNVKDIFLMANAMRANRFVYAYEIPRLRNKLSYYFKKINFKYIAGLTTYAHCVGHGLALRVDFARQYRFPTEIIMEDMIYGYILNYNKIPVVSIPVFDYAEVPNSISVLFKQMSRWFLGPSRFLFYYSYCKNNYKNSRSKLSHFFLNLSCFIISLTWAVTTPVYILLIFTCLYSLSLFYHFSYNLFFIFLLSISCLIVYFLTYVLSIFLHNYFLKSNNINYKNAYLNRSKSFFLIICYPLVIFFHSLPTYHRVLSFLFFRNKNSMHEKTER
jgi:cellulose synthase/poly-beta-1,6-N-acetylglucosamine synthase-like glycosyltransferase